MPSSDRPLQRHEFDSLFQDLADELRARGVTASIVLAGGAYLTCLGLRSSTVDADSMYVLPMHVKEAAAAVAQRRHLQPSWLNDRASAWAPPGAETHDSYTFFEDAALRVSGPHPDAVFLMKINAVRPATEDYADAVRLWPLTTFATPRTATDAFLDAYPHEEFDPHLVDLIADIAALAERRG